MTTHPRSGVVAVVGLIVVLVVGGAVTAVLLLGSDDDASLAFGRPQALPAATDQEPARAWGWESEDPVTSASPDGDGVLLSTEADGLAEPVRVVRLDADGEEDWAVTFEEARSTVSLVDGFLVGIGPDEDGEAVLEVVAVDDEGTRWTRPVVAYAGAAGDRLVATTTEGTVGLDLADGSEAWAVDDVALGFVIGDAVLTGDAESVALIGAEDGDERWSADAAPLGTPALTRTQVVVAGADEVVAFDRDDGTELWSDASERTTAEPLVSGRVLLVESAPEGARLRFASDDGPSERSVELAVRPSTGVVSWLAGDRELVALDSVVLDGDGEVVSDDYQRVGPIREGGYGFDADGGVDRLDLDEVGEPVWTLDRPESELEEYRSTLIVDGGLVYWGADGAVGYR